MATLLRAVSRLFSTPVRVKETGVGMSADAARRSVPIAFGKTMAMKVKDLPSAASFTFEGACATLAVDLARWPIPPGTAYNGEWAQAYLQPARVAKLADAKDLKSPIGSLLVSCYL